jgi:predicted nucleotidyltransferase
MADSATAGYNPTQRRRGRRTTLCVDLSMKTLDEINLRPNDRAAVREAAAILREKFPVEQIVLFGSKARGEDDPESDIDLLVLTSRPLSDRDESEVTRALLALELDLAVVISPLLVCVDDWREGFYQVLPIRREIERDGVAA